MSKSMSKVIYIKTHILDTLGNQVSQLTKSWEQGSHIAVKTHLGEYGNLYHVRPQIIGRVVEELKNNKLKPFVYDTIVKYPGSRDTKEKYQETARRHGFTQETLGCPVVISDQVYNVKTPKLKVGVADCLKNIKYHVVVSHAKGHISAGFGGAIKNMGMGCVGAQTKGLLHEKTKPKLVGACTKCGSCVKVCPKQAITVNEQEWCVDYDKCWGCGYCIAACPQNILIPIESSLPGFLAEASVPIVEGRTNLFINVAMDITSRCDCASNPEPPVCPDIGVFISTDPVAIDLATIDLIKKTCPDFFGKIVKIDPSGQIKRGKELGLGQAKYELEEVKDEE